MLFFKGKLNFVFLFLLFYDCSSFLWLNFQGRLSPVRFPYLPPAKGAYGSEVIFNISFSSLRVQLSPYISLFLFWFPMYLIPLRGSRFLLGFLNLLPSLSFLFFQRVMIIHATPCEVPIFMLVATFER